MLVPGSDVDGACRAHRDLLGDVAPASSLYFIAALIGPGLLVEVEADAVLDPDAPGAVAPDAVAPDAVAPDAVAPDAVAPGRG